MSSLGLASAVEAGVSSRGSESPSDGAAAVAVEGRMARADVDGAPSHPAAIPMWKELLALGKPGIVRMCVLMTIGGILLAPAAVHPLRAIAAALGCALAVVSANAFNMIWEQRTDRLMDRTRGRPLAAGRLDPRVALTFAVATGVIGLVVLAAGANVLSAGLALFAIVGYVLVYTPMKFRSPAALVIGAVPGAIPPLIGWTAATNDLGAPGLILFGILLVWQIPHFLAIALYRHREYEAAGIRCAPLVRGVIATKLQAAAWALLLIPISLALTPLRVTGPLYFFVALVAGIVYFAWALSGLRPGADEKWARGFFLASLVYLPVITLAIVLDVLLF